ncbi:MAG TPA: hypothetical protein VNS81_00215 [Nocardioides sp.]|nr:hypothetical protein [Nocardioides sp.]
MNRHVPRDTPNAPLVVALASLLPSPNAELSLTAWQHNEIIHVLARSGDRLIYALDADGHRTATSYRADDVTSVAAVEFTDAETWGAVEWGVFHWRIALTDGTTIEPRTARGGQRQDDTTKLMHSLLS